MYLTAIMGVCDRLLKKWMMIERINLSSVNNHGSKKPEKPTSVQRVW